MNSENFSTEQLAGQRMMVGFDGAVMSSDIEFLIKELKAGGIILFSRNINSPEQLEELCTSIQMCAREHHQPPLFISIDQEGGPVARLPSPFAQFPGNPSMKSTDDARHFASVTAWELLMAGINMNLAPVLDVSPQNMESIMVKRTFGHDPEWVSALGVEVIRHLQKGGVMAVAKHFPGIGRTVVDSHMDLPVMNADMEDLQAFDLVPFAAAIQEGVAGVMLSHILYPEIDPDWPASLSPRIAKTLLREHMGFDGLVITDDLDMGAVKKHHDIRTMVRQILAADIDIALVCHRGPDMERVFEEVSRSITDSSEILHAATECVRRIMAFKTGYNL
jgi:beta-N-acetylhexosaminidase